MAWRRPRPYIQTLFNAVLSAACTLTNRLHSLDMENPSLPIDICEIIIDACYNSQHHGAIARNIDYAILLRCALVCSAWLPRTRFNLLHRVVLTKSTHLDLLLRTLSGDPTLADLILEVTVLSSYGYIPFASLRTRQFFQACRRLELRFSSWSVHYPPTYWRSVAQFPSIVTLDMSTAGLSLSSILHLIWAFPALRVLRLQEDIEGERVSVRKDLTDGYSKKLSVARPELAGRHLQHLKLSNARMLTSTRNFPPSLAFGTSVTRLKLGVMRTLGLSQAMLACIRDFERLEFLRVGSASYGSSERSDGHLLQHVLPILPNIRSPAFHTLELHVSPWDPFFTTRRTHIELLCGVEMRAFLTRTRTLRTLGLSWPDTDAESDASLYGAKWWTEKIIARMPELSGIVKVEIDSTPGPSLWDPEPPTRTQTSETEVVQESSPVSRGSV